MPIVRAICQFLEERQGCEVHTFQSLIRKQLASNSYDYKNDWNVLHWRAGRMKHISVILVIVWVTSCVLISDWNMLQQGERSSTWFLSLRVSKFKLRVSQLSTINYHQRATSAINDGSKRRRCKRRSGNGNSALRHHVGLEFAVRQRATSFHRYAFTCLLYRYECLALRLMDGQK
jgi:hypothetical protein